MHDVLLNIQRVITTDSARRGQDWIGGAGQSAERLDRSWALHDEGDQRARGDEAEQRLEERLPCEAGALIYRRRDDAGLTIRPAMCSGCVTVIFRTP